MKSTKFLVLLLAGLFFMAVSPLYAQDTPQDTVSGAVTEQISLSAAADTVSAEAAAPKTVENPYRRILTEKSFSFSFKSIMRGLMGMVILLFLAWIFSLDRRHVKWWVVVKALLLQVAIAVSVLAVPFVQHVFEFFGKCFVAILGWTTAGSNFLFGGLMDNPSIGYVYCLSILPTIIFFSALTSILYYFGVLQKVVWVLAWCFTKLMNLSGAEALCTAGNIFVGQTEAPLMAKPYIPSMTPSEIMLIMTAGMSTMAGGVLAAYIAMLGGGDHQMSIEFAKHLLSASVMAAPGAVAFSKILKPQDRPIVNKVEVSKDRFGSNVLDAISNGTTDGLKLAANVGAMLLVFYALIAGVNYILGKVGQWTTFNDLLFRWTDGMYPKFSLQCILSYVFYPIIWLTGINAADLPLVGRLLGEKLIMTEFVGYGSLAEMMREGAFMTTKAVIMSTYILCGFANFASVGIQVGGIGCIAPNQRGQLSAYGMRALLGAALAGLMSATIVGMFLA